MARQQAARTQAARTQSAQQQTLLPQAANPQSARQPTGMPPGGGGLPPVSAADADRCRLLLNEAIEQHWPDLLLGIRLYIRKFGLSTDPSSDEMLARDVLQDAILSALQNSAHFDPACPPRPWLLGIALNCLRHSRRRRWLERKHVVPVAETSEVLAASSEPGTEALSEDEMFGLLYHSTASSRAPGGETLDEMLLPLSQPDRDVLRLHFVDDLRGRDLAAALGINEGQAWARLSRAKQRLRSAYAEDQSKKAPGTRSAGAGTEK